MATTMPRNVYDFAKYKDKGVALIIVNEVFKQPDFLPTREGAREDYSLLQETFGKLGFTVDAHINQTAEDIVRHVMRISHQNHADNACFVMAISSHGNHTEGSRRGGQRQIDKNCRERMDYVYGTDGIPVPFYLLTNKFQEENCPSLKGKPKMYFIQCCRGERLSEEATAEVIPQQPRPVNSQSSGHADIDGCEDAFRKFWIRTKGLFIRPKIIHGDDIPLQRDFLLACSIPPDYLSFHNFKGSRFILELCQVLTDQHNNHDVLRMLTEVNWNVATKYTSSTSDCATNERRMMPWVASMLTKDVNI